ncbi:MAG: filamentous hemagglutinin N-terminal domain-containing protein, partial [Ramlibacter sp.]|nr:filamentous hemagglutinin N-terminal domain-containing protein [Ramlibacter sp.]
MNHAHRTGRQPAPAQAVTPFALRTLAVALMLSFAASSQAGPAGGVVAAGSASIAVTGARTTITQTTQNAAINWQSFGIAAGESVQFAQPNSSSVALNRVLGANPSAIFGNLSANGKVFLINPNGVLFGAGSTVNVGGLVASTLGLSDADFMAGQYRFSSPGRGAVVNEGTIRADGGSVALLGTNVSNQGVISARLGSVVLAGGNAITLDWGGDGLLGVKVDQGAVDALVTNGGLIQADGGRVVMTTQAAGNLLSTVVNNTGVIQARTILNRAGSIMLSGDMQSGTVSAGGTLDVSGAGVGQSGGSVTLTGHHVGIFSGHIDASGNAGGGTVLVGGDYLGKNADVPNASATYMSADSTITA